MSDKRNDNKSKKAAAFDARPDVDLIDPVDLDGYGTNDPARPGGARDSHHAAAQNRTPAHRTSAKPINMGGA